MDGEALEHKYVSQFHDPMVEVGATDMVRPSVDDSDKKSTAFYRDKLYTDLNRKKSQERERERGFGGGGGSVW